MKVCISPLGIAILIAIAEICVFHTQIAFAQDQSDSSHAAYLNEAIQHCNTQMDPASCIIPYEHVAPYCTLEDTKTVSPNYEMCKIVSAQGNSNNAATTCRAPSNRDGACTDDDTTFPGDEQ